MLSTRKPPVRRVPEHDRVPEDLDIPIECRRDFYINRLGDKRDSLFLLTAHEPIAITAVAARTTYYLPMSYRLNKIELYQTDAAGAESDDALNIRLEVIHLDNTPGVIHNKQGVSWETGQDTLTGKRYMTPGSFDVIVDGTATNLLYIKLEVNTYNVQ